MELLLIILQYLFPRDPIRRVWIAVHAWLSNLIDVVELDSDLLASDPALRITFESRLAEAEDVIRMLIEARARQIAGIRLYRPFRPCAWLPSRARPLNELLAQFARIARLHDDIERLAQLRAERLKRETERNPLCIPEIIIERVARIPSPHTVSCLALGEADGLSRRSAAKATGGSLHVRGPP